MRTCVGDVLCVHSGGIINYVYLCSPAASTDVAARLLIELPVAGYPFLLGLQVFEARLFAHPLGPASPSYLHVDDVRNSVLKHAELRRARAAEFPIVMLHENDEENGGCEFARFFQSCVRRP